MVVTKVWMIMEALLTDWVNMLGLRDDVQEQTGVRL